VSLVGLRFITSLPLVLGYAPAALGANNGDLAAVAVDACPTMCEFRGGS